MSMIGEPVDDLPLEGGRRTDWAELAAQVRQHANRWVPVVLPLSPKTLATLASHIHRGHRGAPLTLRADTTGQWDARVRQGQIYLRFTPSPTSITSRRKGRTA